MEFEFGSTVYVEGEGETEHIVIGLDHLEVVVVSKITYDYSDFSFSYSIRRVPQEKVTLA